MSKNSKFDFAVAIGRFNPVHIAHLKNFQKGLEIADKLIIIVGSANSARTTKNPFTENERIQMISSCFTEKDLKRIHFNVVEDNLYQNAKWFETVQGSIDAVVKDYFPGNVNEAKICLIGHDKDASSWYLNSIPYELIDVGPYKILEQDKNISSTMIRDFMFNNTLSCIQHFVHKNVYKYLAKFYDSEIFKNLKQEYDSDVKYIKEAHQNMVSGTYSTNFLCSDAVVVQSGHVLLIKRGKSPGAGLFALPGGHLHSDEGFFDGAIRELIEETKIKVPLKVLKGSFILSQVFDHPDRSLRGKIGNKNSRTVTVAHLFKLDDNEKLPRITPSDDAVRSDRNWFTFAEIKQMKNQLFEDHGFIIEYMINRL